MTGEDRIDLAHQAPFALGALSVLPPTREIVLGDTREVLEPRVMQVLVALARADGAILSRDDLGRMCWENRVVGEDSINRVMSRLRRVAEGIGKGSFHVETVTKVGYRLIREGGAVPVEAAVVKSTPAPASRINRRGLIAGGLAAGGVLAAGGGTAWWLSRHKADPAVATLLQQGGVQMMQASPEGVSQAIGLFRRATQIDPDYADAWGMLASAYSNAAHGRAASQVRELRDRTRSAAARALALDPANPYAKLALSGLMSRSGGWTGAEKIMRDGLAARPGDIGMSVSLGFLLASVGRNREAAALLDGLMARIPPAPGPLFMRAQCLWAADRLEDADRAIAEMYALFPMHFAVWFTRFYYLTYAGHPDEALAMANDVGSRPPGIPDDNFNQVIACARAVQSRSAADIDAALAIVGPAARAAAGACENVVAFAAFVGRPDIAFMLCDAYYFGRGFEIGDVRFTRQQGTYTRRGDRNSRFLFGPAAAPLRKDARFAALVGEIGLDKYWRDAGVQPDYRRTA